jgi:hypothetical protein
MKTMNNLMVELGIPPIPENFITGAIFDEPDLFSSIVTCVLFSKLSTKEPRTWARGLMLQSTGTDDTYRRVGLWATAEERPDLVLFWETFKRRTITLV